MGNGEEIVRRHYYLTLEEDALLADAAKNEGRSKNGMLRALVRALKVRTTSDRPAVELVNEMRKVYRENR